MEEHMQGDTVAVQQAAIQEVRARYERGNISYEAFRRALDALVLAHDEEECRAVLAAIPAGTEGALAALDPVAPRPAALAPFARAGRHRWVVAIMAATKKTRRRWRLEPLTRVVAVMGEVKVDLNMADLPPRARIEVAAIMGDVTVYVPRSLRVAVHTMAVMGEVDALGESNAGMVAFGHEAHEPEGAPAADVVIHTYVVMGHVKVVLTDGPVVTVSEVVREAMRAVTDGLRRGFVGGGAE
jgi:Cell wall-active antibiotics response LiaF, C-terminal